MKWLTKNRAGFTLIEMLAVLGIIAIVLSIAVPAFGPMIRTMKLNTAAENLASTLEAARQHAVTNGQNCYVVFPVGTNDTSLDCRAYKMYDPNNQNTVGKWEFLPAGVMIDNLYTGFITNSISINFPEDNSTTTATVRYIGFDPSGKTDTTQNGTIKLNSDSASSFACITYYNNSPNIKRWGLGDEPSE